MFLVCFKMKQYIPNTSILYKKEKRNVEDHNIHKKNDQHHLGSTLWVNTHPVSEQVDDLYNHLLLCRIREEFLTSVEFRKEMISNVSKGPQ